MTDWWAFSSGLSGHSFVRREASPKAARNEATISGTSHSGPYPNRKSALNALRNGTTNAKAGMRKRTKAQVLGARIVDLARTWLGVPYLYGGVTRQGVDCSGLVMQVAHAAGITDCPRTSEEQWAWVHKIPADQVGAGDLVFFVGAEIDPPPGHVAIVVTPGRMIDAPFTGALVRYDNYAPGTGPNQIIGYGRMPGVGYSKTANYSTAGTTSAASKSGEAVGIAGGTIASIVILLFVVVLFVALILIALMFKGSG
jgi:cell wall-associated NlpC family hydrolase